MLEKMRKNGKFCDCLWTAAASTYLRTLIGSLFCDCFVVRDGLCRVLRHIFPYVKTSVRLVLVLNECDITYRSIRSATTLIRVHAVLDRISVASSILFVVHSNEAHFLFHFKFYHLSSNISIDSIPLFNCFVSLSFQTKMCYVIQFYGHQIGSNVYGPMSFGLVLCC